MNIESIATNIEKIKPGYYRAKSNPERISYTHEGHQKIEKSEDDSFWFQHRSRCIATLINNYPSKTIVDVGGGNGKVSRMIQDMGIESLLMEPINYATDLAWKNGQKNIIQGTIESSGTKPNSLPAVGLFDVLEHIEDDTDFLIQIYSKLEKDGMLYITVPAYQFLFSNFDINVGHYRRYSLKELERKVNDAGFKILFASYLFLPLPLPMIIRKVRKRPSAVSQSDHVKINSLIGRLLMMILEPERIFIKKNWKVPFGSSCILVAKKI